ncbi:protein MAIN-LIKE 2-like [Glycine soja]|uniref:protein MAIN-LIKE 2-like n=1 Tax=Glycine soja TaxID=3848 RepID=UPI00103A9332|nr:protein MAIN-LIKE 2-like [Glycine soja]
MVRTRGLGRALGRVIGRALGREDRHDSDDALQRRRPTASKRRQWEAAPVVEDEPVVAAEEPVVAIDVHAPGADTADDVEGFPGGPRDPLVLTEYADHVAISCLFLYTSIHDRPELKLSFHERKVQKFGRPTSEIEGLVVAMRLSPLIACSVDTGDWGLISAFVERWHRETSRFHLSVGEVSITLDDVASLLHLPIVGAFHTFKPLHVDEVVLMLVELLEVSGEAARAETAQCHGPYSATHVHVVFLDALRDLSQSGRYAWGAAALVHMYDHLNDACRSSSRQLAACWLHHSLTVTECMVDPDYDEVSPHAYRWIATKAIVKSISRAMYRQCLDQLRIPISDGSPLPSDTDQRGSCASLDTSRVPEPPTTLTHARSDVDRTRHAVDACHAIAERLERLLNLRIVMVGTETHEVMEQCIKIARGVIEDHIVYVRSRRRRRTD